MSFVLQPCKGRIYVILDPVAEMKIGLIHLPDKHREPSRIGTVKAIGEEVTEFNPGDRVVVSFFSGVVVERPEITKPGDSEDVHRVFTKDEIYAKIVEA